MYIIRLLSSLEKVFLDRSAGSLPVGPRFTALQGETFSFQAACFGQGRETEFAHVRVRSPLAPCLRVREVKHMPCRYPAKAERDAQYLRVSPGLYPDLLTALHGDSLMMLTPGQWSTLWIDAELNANVPPGEYPIALALENDAGEILCQAQTSLMVYGAVLKPQTLLRTEWFHADCLADYYGVEPLSQSHWEIMERFIAAAAKRGCNMILTPQFTPPLDTAIGGERTTVQLIGVQQAGDEYAFDFSLLERWVHMCRNAGIRYFEMSHLFTQWGAKAAPKVMGVRDGVYSQLFGWQSEPVGGAYTAFLQAYLPKLLVKLHELGIAQDTYFHISDEPEEKHLSRYLAARDSVRPYLAGRPIMDALSSYEVYQKGGPDIPVCANDAIEPFLEHGVPHLWTYYCTGQTRLVSNRFMAMPSSRTRVYGYQVFKYGLEGVLHWGYNFYNTMHSRFAVDPYRDTDAGGSFPSGDPFLVYPGLNGTPEESIRMMVMSQAMQDVCAFQMLAERSGKDHVLALAEKGLSGPVTFSRYPMGSGWLLKLRNAVNAELALER